MFDRVLSTATDNLVAYWPLGEATGSTAEDFANSNDGSATGCALGYGGIGDGSTSYYFDGSTSYVDISAIISNLVSNGGFETAGGGGADIWANWSENAGDGALANETTNIHTGADSAKITAGGSADTYIDQDITVVSGATYQLRFWTRGDGSDEGRYSIYDNDNTADIVALTTTGVTGTSFVKVEQSFTAPAGCTSVRVRFQCSATNAAVSYFDTVFVRRTDIATFDPHEGSILLWAKVSGSGVWTDGTTRRAIEIRADPNMYADIYRSTTNNEVIIDYRADGTRERTTLSGLSTTGWMSFGIAWSLSGDYVKTYYGGALQDTHGSLGTWAGKLDSALANIGSYNNSGTSVWDGTIAHVSLYNTPLSADQIAYLSEKP